MMMFLHYEDEVAQRFQGEFSQMKRQEKIATMMSLKLMMKLFNCCSKN